MFRKIAIISYLGLAAAPIFPASRTMPWPTDVISVAVDGNLRQIKDAPIIDGELCMALRALRETFGGNIRWDRVARRFTYRREGREAEFRLDADAVTIDGKTVVLPTAIRSWDSDAYVPVALFARAEFQNLVGSKV